MVLAQGFILLLGQRSLNFLPLAAPRAELAQHGDDRLDDGQSQDPFEPPPDLPREEVCLVHPHQARAIVDRVHH